MSNKKPTTAAGAPVVDNFNIETAGPRGSALLQEVWLIEKLAHFDREVISEQRIHVKGAGAHGIFTVTGDIARFTKADIFAELGKSTPMLARFSTVPVERGAANAKRDIRAFALKFHTNQGNLDLDVNNTTVFFFRDPLRFPDLNHAVKRNPQDECVDGHIVPNLFSFGKESSLRQISAAGRGQRARGEIRVNHSDVMASDTTRRRDMTLRSTGLPSRTCRWLNAP